MKLFKSEIERFLIKLQNNENFALSRFSDGEMLAMRGHYGISGCGEWVINADDERYAKARGLLCGALSYKDPGFYAGIVCPCCQGYDNFHNMKTESGQDEEHLTFANVFVNANYKFFIDNYIDVFRSRETMLITHESANVNALPFGGEYIPVKYNAWVENADLLGYLKESNYSNKLFLLACGPLGRILAAELWKVNKTNTYLDIGSTLGPWLECDLNVRCYYSGIPEYADKVCVWG